MYQIDKQVARTYLKSRGLLPNAVDIIEVADDFISTKEVYSNANSSSLVMMQDFGDLNAAIYADTHEALEDCLGWLPTRNITFRVKQKWIADILQNRRGVSIYWINYHYAYTNGIEPTIKPMSARCLGAEDLLAVKRCAEKEDLPDGHPARIDYALEMQIKGNQAKVFGQMMDDDLVSYVRLNPMHLSDDDEGKVWDVTDIWTAEDKRGQGFAKDTLAASTLWVINQGKVPYYSGVKSDNIASRKTCESIGFEKICESIHLR